MIFFFFSSRRRHTRSKRDWSSDVCSSDLELDEAVWLWGHDLEVIGAFVDRVGPLEIDVEDTVHAILRTATGVPIDVALDYLSRRYRRGVEVVGAEATIRYDWSTTDLTIESAGGVECCNIDTPIAESYEREAD